uniref:CCHC-type domain-containing protein n=1 Tax=Tanacetum cinerariifolium TaxID=118510 RepID=A0A699I202_TANCI|nr:hypothetical protein [Tanacetum cinerariifolium]
MDSQSAPVVSAAKLPTLNPNEFDLWKIRIEQYFLMIDYSLWEVIINGDSVISRVDVDGVAQPVTVLTAEQKLARKNELKACGTLLMALPDKHQLKFNTHKDAKTIMKAIEKRFGGNTKTNKVQKTILKQKFKNFTGSSSEDLDQIHDRLQNLVSQLEIHRVSLSQEDVNLKFLRSLPSEWKTHTLIWRNKANLEEHSLDDLFNSLKIYETEVRHSSSLSNPTQNLAFVSSSNTDSITDSVSAATSVSAVCAKLPVSSYSNIDSLSNAIDVDDLEEIDLRWQMAMLTIRAKRFLQKTGRNLGDNRVTTMGFDMSKVECYNCHRKRHFARECKSPKDTRRTGGAEPHRRTTPEEPANFALMAIPSSSSSNNEVRSCSTACSKAYNQLHSQYDSQTVEFCKSRLDVLSYQAALESIESRLVVYKQNESIFQENIIVLKNEVEARDNFILTLKQKLKQAETERDDLKLKFKHFQLSSKSLTELIASQTNNKHGLGYLSSEDDSKRNFMPPKPELVFNTAPLDVESDHSAFNVQVSDSEDESESNDPHSVFVQPVEVPILAATPKPTIKTSSSGKRKNRKTCFVCKSVDHLIKDCNFHVKPQTTPSPRNSAHRGCNKQYASFTKKYPQKHKVPAAVLPKSKPVSVNAFRQVSATVPKIMKSRPRPAHPVNRKSNPSIRRYNTHNQFSKTSNSSLKVTATKVSVVSVVKDNPQYALKDKGVIDSGCSRHMIGNMSYLSDFQELNSGYVAFGGKFEGKVDEGFLVGYSVNSKAFRVFNSRTRIIQETLHVNFLENKPNVAGTGPTWLFDIDSLTKTINYQPVTAGNQTNLSAGFQDTFDADKVGKGANLQYVLFPVWSTGSLNPQNKEGDTVFDKKEHDAKKPESAVNLSPSRSTLSREKDNMTKKKDKGKSPVECFSEYRDLNAVFEDFF